MHQNVGMQWTQWRRVLEIFNTHKPPVRQSSLVSLKMQSCGCALMLQLQRGQNESDCMSEHMHDMVTLERDPGPASLDTSACTTAQHSNKTHCPTSPIPTLLPMSTVTTPMYTFPHRFEVIFQVLPSYRVRQIAHIDSSSHLNLTPALCTIKTH